MEIRPVDPASETAPFEQLRGQIARRASAGDFEAGQKLPTVRSLAAELGLATNTVARAYRELEADGVVVTEGRRGTFIASGPAAAALDIRAVAAEYAGLARRNGLTRHDAVRLFDDAWDQSTRG